MKNALQYYYGINPEQIHQKNKKYFFKIDSKKYVLLESTRTLEELKEIYELSKKTFENGIYSHEIILNNTGELITFINHVPYILLRIYVDPNEPVILSDIIFFQNKTINLGNNILLRRDDWYTLWTNKIDYFEYQVSQLSKKYHVIQESFSYFCGIAETAITLYKMLIKKDNSLLSISHKRLTVNDTLFELYNPLNYILDVRSRDASEYFKTVFLKQEDISEEIIYYLTYSELTEYEYQLFFARMLFPTFYFDLYEEVITGSEKEKELLYIVTQVSKYEKLLIQIYSFLKQRISLPNIEWLNK